jgi:Putative lumazine-binding
MTYDPDTTSLMKKFLFLLLLTTPALAQTPTPANADEVAVRQTIDQLSAGMKAADTTMIRSVFTPTIVSNTIVKNPNTGMVVVRAGTVPELLKAVAQQKPGALDERLTGYTIHIDGDMAMAWVPYTFYYNGQQVHCGIDAFALVRTANGWKIQYLMDTRRACP